MTLVRRHPHVYGSSDASSTDAVLAQWEDIKRSEKGDEAKPYLHGVGKASLLLRAAKLQKKASRSVRLARHSWNRRENR